MPSSRVLTGFRMVGGTAVYVARDHEELRPWRERLATRRGKLVASVALYGGCGPNTIAGFTPREGRKRRECRANTSLKREILTELHAPASCRVRDNRNADRRVSIRNAHMERRRHCRCLGGELRRTLALLRRARPRNQGAVAGPMWPARNAGVRGGTMSSNLLCSSSQSVSAVNA